jgi:ElaB/YqjD/DUF883 family membrane-anchored ribosome-binding protein
VAQQRSDYPLDYSKAPRSSTDHPRERAADAGQRVNGMAGDAQEWTGRAAEQVRQFGEKAQDAAQKFKPFVEKSMKEQPLATLAVASVIGFVLGALWKK